jgi:hypothetical protein
LCPFTVETSIGSEKVAVTFELTSIPERHPEGPLDVTTGGVVSGSGSVVKVQRAPRHVVPCLVLHLGSHPAV